jgi:hypothetical protein
MEKRKALFSRVDIPYIDASLVIACGQHIGISVDIKAQNVVLVAIKFFASGDNILQSKCRVTFTIRGPSLGASIPELDHAEESIEGLRITTCYAYQAAYQMLPKRMCYMDHKPKTSTKPTGRTYNYTNL